MTAVSPLHRPVESRTALGRADQILGAFDAGHPSLSLLGLVARTGLPKTTVYRTVEKMIELGWLAQVEGRYCLGNRVFELAGLTGLQVSLRGVALPYLAELNAATRETVHLAVLDRDDVLYLEKLAGHGPTIGFSRVGGRMPAHCTGLGKVLVAHSGTDSRAALLDRPLTPRTSATIVSPRAMERELTRIAADGIGLDREETAVGMSCVAAPVVAADGRCVAAVSVAGPSPRMRIHQLARAVRTTAAGVSRALATTSVSVA